MIEEISQPSNNNGVSDSFDDRGPPRRRTLFQTRHPFIPIVIWTALNAAALAASLLLAVELIFALDDWHEKPNAAGLYLIWNFSTTLLWVVEVSFRVYDWRLHHHRRREREIGSSDGSFLSSLRNMTTVDSIELVVEWTFAMLFTIDSIKLLIKWKVKNQDIEEDLVEAVLNIIAFGYITIATLQDYHEETMAARNESDYQQLGEGNVHDRIPDAETPLVI